MGCSSSLAKFILFFFNVCFWICGVVLFSAGVWALAGNTDKFFSLLEIDAIASKSLVKFSAVALIIVGLVILLTGFLGCCGAMKENVTMLTCYSTILVLILLLQVAAGITAIIFRNQINSKLGDSMMKAVQEKYGADEAVTDAYDLLQKELKCCGANNYSDWQTSHWIKNTTAAKVPASCCSGSSAEIIRKCEQLDDGFYYKEGCTRKLYDWFRKNAMILFSVALGLAVFEMFICGIACCLRGSLKKQEYNDFA